VLNAIPATAGAVNSTYLLDGSVTTAKVADANITPAKLSQPLTLGTAVASTSGTSIDFTSIPSWVKRITVIFSGVSVSGSSSGLVQIGAGSVASTGYISNWGYIQTTANINTSSSTAGFGFWNGNTADTRYMHMVITLVSANTWVASHQGAFTSGGTYLVVGGGNVTLGGTLDRLRITTVGGTDTFDAGSINILYE
jgi:hypothetical protein